MKKKKKESAIPPRVGERRFGERRFRVERVKSCPLANAPCAVVFPDALFEDIVECVSEIRNEFILFLIGDRANRVAHVRDVYVPRQRVSAATVDAEEMFDPSAFIGIAHSHHDMGAFHSPTDEGGVDNAPISVVMSTRGWCAKYAHKLPCGRWGVSQNVMIVRESESRDAVARASRDHEVPRAPLSRARMGDCPDARAGTGMTRVGCGITARTNVLLQEIRKMSREEFVFSIKSIKLRKEEV